MVALKRTGEEPRNISLLERWRQRRSRSSAAAPSDSSPADSSASSPETNTRSTEDVTWFVPRTPRGISLIFAKGILAQQKLMDHLKADPNVGNMGAQVQKHFEELSKTLIFPFDVSSIEENIQKRFVLNEEEKNKYIKDYIRWMNCFAGLTSNWEQHQSQGSVPANPYMTYPNIFQYSNNTSVRHWFQDPQMSPIIDMYEKMLRESPEKMGNMQDGLQEIRRWGALLTTGQIENLRRQSIDQSHQFYLRLGSNIINFIDNEYAVAVNHSGNFVPTWSPLYEKYDSLKKETAILQDARNRIPPGSSDQMYEMNENIQRNFEELQEILDENKRLIRQMNIKQYQDRFGQDEPMRYMDTFGDVQTLDLSRPESSSDWMQMRWNGFFNPNHLSQTNNLDDLDRSLRNSNRILLNIGYDAEHGLGASTNSESSQQPNQSAQRWIDLATLHEQYMENNNRQQDRRNPQDPYSSPYINHIYNHLSEPQKRISGGQEIHVPRGATFRDIPVHEGLTHPDDLDRGGNTVHDLEQRISQDYYNEDLAKYGRRLPQEGVAYNIKHGDFEAGDTFYIRFGPYVLSMSALSAEYDPHQMAYDMLHGKPWKFDTEANLWRRADGTVAPFRKVASVNSLVQYRTASPEEKDMSQYAEILGKALIPFQINDMTFSPAQSSNPEMRARRIDLGLSRRRIFNSLKAAVMKAMLPKVNYGPAMSLEITRKGGQKKFIPSLGGYGFFLERLSEAGGLDTDGFGLSDTRVKFKDISRNPNAKLVIAQYRANYGKNPEKDPTLASTFHRIYNNIHALLFRKSPIKKDESRPQSVTPSTNQPFTTDPMSMTPSAQHATFDRIFNEMKGTPSEEQVPLRMPKQNWTEGHDNLTRSLVFKKSSGGNEISPQIAHEMWRILKEKDPSKEELDNASDALDDKTGQSAIQMALLAPRHDGMDEPWMTDDQETIYGSSTRHDLEQIFSQDHYDDVLARIARRLPFEGVPYKIGSKLYVRFGPYAMNFVTGERDYDIKQLSYDLIHGKPWKFDSKANLWRRADGTPAPFSRSAMVGSLIQYRSAFDDEKDMEKYAHILGKALGSMHINNMSFLAAHSNNPELARRGIDSRESRKRLFIKLQQAVMKKTLPSVEYGPAYSIKSKDKFLPSPQGYEDFIYELGAANALSVTPDMDPVTKEYIEKISHKDISRNTEAKTAIRKYVANYGAVPHLNNDFTSRVNNMCRHLSIYPSLPLTPSDSERKIHKLLTDQDIAQGTNQQNLTRHNHWKAIVEGLSTMQGENPIVSTPQERVTPMERSLVFKVTFQKASILDRWRAFRNRNKPDRQQETIPETQSDERPSDEKPREKTVEDIIRDGVNAELKLKLHAQASSGEIDRYINNDPSFWRNTVGLYTPEEAQKWGKQFKLSDKDFYAEKRKYFEWIKLCINDLTKNNNISSDSVMVVSQPNTYGNLNNFRNYLFLPQVLKSTGGARWLYSDEKLKSLAQMFERYGLRRRSYSDSVEGTEKASAFRRKIDELRNALATNGFGTARNIKSVVDTTNPFLEINKVLSGDLDLSSLFEKQFPNSLYIKGLPFDHPDYKEYKSLQNELVFENDEIRKQEISAKINEIEEKFKNELRNKFKEKLNNAGFDRDKIPGLYENSPNLYHYYGPQPRNFRADPNDGYDYWKQFSELNDRGSRYIDADEYPEEDLNDDEDYDEQREQEIREEVESDWDNENIHDEDNESEDDFLQRREDEVGDRVAELLEEDREERRRGSLHAGLGPEDQEDYDGKTDHDYEQRRTQDYYPYELARAARRMQREGSIGQLQNGNYIIRSGPYAMEFSLENSDSKTDHLQLMHDVFWGKPWEYDKNNDALQRQNGEHAPYLKMANVVGLCQYRSAAPEDKNFEKYVHKIIDALSHYGVNDVSFNPASSSRRVGSNRFDSGNSRRRLFHMIMRSAWKQNMKNDPNFTPPFTIKERGKIYPSVGSYSVERDATPIFSSGDRTPEAQAYNAAKDSTAHDQTRSIFTDTTNPRVNLRLKMAARKREGLPESDVPAPKPDSGWHLEHPVMERSFANIDEKFVQSLWRQRKNKGRAS